MISSASNSARRSVLEKQRARLMDSTRETRLELALCDRQATPGEIRELGHLGLARRLLQVKFWHSPSYNNAELAALLQYAHENTLMGIMTRRYSCSNKTFELLCEQLWQVETTEGIPTIAHPMPSDWTVL